MDQKQNHSGRWPVLLDLCYEVKESVEETILKQFNSATLQVCPEEKMNKTLSMKKKQPMIFISKFIFKFESIFH